MLMMALSLAACMVRIPVGSTAVFAASQYYRVSVATGYLALRTAMAYDSRNEIGELYTGDVVEYVNSGNGTYWYVYSPKLNLYGYVNSSYLVSTKAPMPTATPVPVKPKAVQNGNYGVRVSSGYLALRTAMAFDSRNEIGELYNGDTVQYAGPGNEDYWYVYSPKYNKYGYVNCVYLYYINTSQPDSSAVVCGTYQVGVSSGYLALRSAMEMNASNEIGALYTGDTVEFLKAGDGTYWYVYSPKYDQYGYVNKNYLTYLRNDYANVTSGSNFRVSVPANGYLALRTDMVYDSTNEIGRLYTGDTVQYIRDGNGTYWYVYSPKLGRYGYINRVYVH